ncbi:GTP-binding protein [Virgibacillus natechei]
METRRTERSELVFIGNNLTKNELEKGFHYCVQ